MILLIILVCMTNVIVNGFTLKPKNPSKVVKVEGDKFDETVINSTEMWLVELYMP